MIVVGILAVVGIVAVVRLTSARSGTDKNKRD